MMDDDSRPGAMKDPALSTHNAEPAANPGPAHCRGHVVRRIIAAFRRGGIHCAVVLTDGDTPR